MGAAQNASVFPVSAVQTKGSCPEGERKNLHHLPEMPHGVYETILSTEASMFGYINVNAKELTKENKEIYQSYYCGLCKELYKNSGTKGQMLLNYDITFLVVLLTGLYEPQEEKKEFVCALHPFKKRTRISSRISEYAADMNVMLAYFKLIDDWQDEHKLSKRAMAALLQKDYQRMAQKYPRQSGAIQNYIQKLSEFENRNETNIDLVAGLTGEVVGELFAWRQDEWYDELKTLGLYLGKFIYLMDAYEDLDRDEKRDAYNPLRALQKTNEQDFEVIVKLMMTSMMSECAKSFERLPIILHADILRNIIYSGVWTKYEYLQMKRKKRKKE